MIAAASALPTIILASLSAFAFIIAASLSTSDLTVKSTSAASALSLSAFLFLSACILPYMLSAISAGKSALLILTSTSSIPNSRILGFDCCFTLFIICSRLVFIISTCKSEAISLLNSDEMISMALDAAKVSLRVVLKNNSGSTIFPLA